MKHRPTYWVSAKIFIRAFTVVCALLSIHLASVDVFASHDTLPHFQSTSVAIAMSSFNFNVGRLPCPLEEGLSMTFNCDLDTQDIHSANDLDEYDTIVLYQFCEIGDPDYVFFRLALTEWLAEGGKLIIYDSDRCGTGRWQTPVDYSWLHTSGFDARFQIASAGQLGGPSGALEIVAENKLSMKNPDSPYFIDTQILIDSGSEAAADANVIIPTGTSALWCADINAVNKPGDVGYVHAFTAPWATGNGWVIYNGLDMDALLEINFEQVEKLWTYELLHGWGGAAEWRDVMPKENQCVAKIPTQPQIPPVVQQPPTLTMPTTPTTTPIVPTTPALVAAFHVSQEIFTHKPVFFIDQSADLQGRILSWQWDLGDGTTSTEQNPAHIYIRSGEYTAKLTVTNDRGVVATREVSLQVNNQIPTAAFDYEPIVPKIYQNVRFIDHSSDNGKILKWFWDFGDGTTADTQTASHTYEKEGIYQVRLVVADDEDSSSDPLVRTIEVQRAPVVSSFTFTQKLVTHEPIEFVEHARAFSSMIVVWRWNFGDGTLAEGQTASHTYEKSGNYAVSLQVEDKFMTSDQYEVVLHIINPKPVAGFDFEPPAPKTSDTVKFKNESKDNGTIAGWRWDFGDGTTSNEENSSHNYAKAGQYKVTLIVTDDEGVESEPFTRTIEAGGTAPEASFTLAPTDPFEKEQVTFDASASKDIDGDIKEWNWDFGDETACPPDCGSGTPQKPTHTYAKPGRYTVYLLVKDNTDMESKPAKQIVDVGMRALAGFIADPKALGTPQVPNWLDYYLRDGKASQDEVTDILWRVIVGAYVPGTYYRPVWTDFQAVHEIHQLRELAEKYRGIEVAHADGYVEAGPYVEGVGQALVERSRFGKEVNHIKPPVLLYLKDKDGRLQLAGVRFVASNGEAANRFGVTNWPKIPAAAHYADGSTVLAKTRDEAPATNGSAAFVFWQPDLYVLTLWVMQPNPAGFFSPVYQAPSK